ncbi:hypothetical protein D1AOALGA4SA_2671 [Olavius algarvensis Delta 1 endosymbiont]|nr:hypothetical protein D1AOALGA4SA_2671 [Olavius algarvensis Delta 1 endosymbiont]
MRIGGIATLYQFKWTVRHRSSRQAEFLKIQIQKSKIAVNLFILKSTANSAVK